MIPCYVLNEVDIQCLVDIDITIDFLLNKQRSDSSVLHPETFVGCCSLLGFPKAGEPSGTLMNVDTPHTKTLFVEYCKTR